MAASTGANGGISHSIAPSAQDNPDVKAPAQDNTEVKAPARPSRKRIQKPNYAKIHANPLPLDVYPLPAFIPHSPLSLIRIAATIIHQFFSRPSSHPSTPYVGYFSSESRSVHVTNPVHVRALWEMGFFGKGTLSRSEPSWLDREKARLKAGAAGSAEEATRKRREERKLFKLERARVEREQIEQTLKQEKAAAAGSVEERATQEGQEPSAASIESRASSLSHVFPWQADSISKDTPTINDILANDSTQNLIASASAEAEVVEIVPQAEEPTRTTAEATTSVRGDDTSFEPEEPVVKVNQEHLQLTLEEAFFLSYGLGVLDVRAGPSEQVIKTKDLFTLSWKHSIYPPAEAVEQLRPDDPFLLNYAVYHYYRSLGWVVRPGVKFSADFMLYNRGPVFSHAEFAVIIIPEYSQNAPANERKESRDWWWLHCINRVQSQVRKSLVICYVEVPTMADLKAVGDGNIGGILRQYKVREFVLRRFLANRSRD